MSPDHKILIVLSLSYLTFKKSPTSDQSKCLLKPWYKFLWQFDLVKTTGRLNAPKDTSCVLNCTIYCTEIVCLIVCVYQRMYERVWFVGLLVCSSALLPVRMFLLVCCIMSNTCPLCPAEMWLVHCLGSWPRATYVRVLIWFQNCASLLLIWLHIYSHLDWPYF